MSVTEVSGAEAREKFIQRLRILWGKRKFLTRTTFAGFLFGVLLAFLLPARYESSTQLMPPDNQSTSGMAMLAAMSARTGTGLGAFAGDLLGLKSTAALFVGILRSRTLEDRLINKFELKKVYGARLSEDARNILSNNTTVSEDRKSGIITITVTDKNPQRAATIARSYVEELNRLVADLNTSAAHRERVFLEERLSAAKEDLDNAAKEFSVFASKNAAIDIKEQGRAMVEAAATLQGQLIAAQSELEGLRQIYTNNNVRVRSVQARVAELQKQLERLGGANAGATPQKQQPEESLYPSIRKLPLLGVAYADLYRRVKIEEAVYETLTQQYELAKVQEAKETPSVKVLDPAQIPEQRSGPFRRLIVFVCTILSLGLGLFWVLGVAYWKEMDTRNAGSTFAREILESVKEDLPWSPQNGHGLSSRAINFFNRSERKRKQQSEQE